MSISFRQVYYVIFTLLGLGALLYVGRMVMIPLAFALLSSFILYPICKFLEKKGAGRLWAVLWTLLSVILVVSGLTFLFSAQIIKIVEELGGFRDRLQEIFLAVTQFVNERISILPDVSQEDLKNLSKKWFSDQSNNLVKATLSSTSKIVSGLVLVIIYTFLILLYRRGLKETFVNFADEDKRPEYAKMVDSMQKVGQMYLTGMFTLIVILGLLNSLGLLFLGIDYAFFFGYLAAFIAIIPYVGTLIGGAIPTIYAFMNYDSWWYPVGVILIFWFVQILDGNFLNPKIVGGNLNLNALVAILALIIGGYIWGIAGMILFLPYTAVFKVACDHYEELKPVGHVLQDDMYRGGGGSDSLLEKVKRKFGKK